MSNPLPLIVGVGMSPFGRHHGRSLSDLVLEAVRAALADARLPVDAIDAVFFGNSADGLLNGQESIRGQVALKALPLGGPPVYNVENACATGATAVQLAWHQVRSGAVRCALVVGCEKMFTEDKSAPLRAVEACCDLDEIAAVKAQAAAAGSQGSIFMDFYARKAQRYFAEHGGNERHLAMIAAKNHSAGALNPWAQSRTPRSVDEVLASREIADPIRLLMCAPVSDGASALLLADASWATERGCAGPAITGVALASDDFSTGNSQIARTCRRAFQIAGIEPAAIDVAEVHDATAAGELFEYESIGLAEAGRGWTLLEEGVVMPGGRCPVNPSGGLIARGHPLGATGVAQVIELALQVAGRAGARQVPGARTGVAQCAGGQSAFARTSGAAAISCIVVQS
jgi:acetyl-CoA acetyltransferase